MIRKINIIKLMIITIIIYSIFITLNCKYDKHKKINIDLHEEIQIKKSIFDAKNKYNLYRSKNLTLSYIPNNINEYLISVILPVYNMEEYISSVIRSIQSQTMKNLEIIIIDDKSTDKTIEIIQELMMIDNRIKLYENQYNRGTLFTRSLGAFKANGKYVTFIDPDDFFYNQNILEEIYEVAEKNNVDIVEFQSMSGKEDKIKYLTKDRITKDNTIFLKDNLITRIYELHGKITYNAGSIWGKLIRRTPLMETMNYLRNKGILEAYIPNGQDVLVTTYLLHFCKSLIFIKKKGIFYYIREGSSTNIGKDQVKLRIRNNGRFKIVNTFHRYRYDLTMKSNRKYYKYWFNFFINTVIKYTNRSDKKYQEFINNLDNCEYCSEDFKNYVHEKFNKILINDW